jgi:hypothetical protein
VAWPTKTQTTELQPGDAKQGNVNKHPVAQHSCSLSRGSTNRVVPQVQVSQDTALMSPQHLLKQQQAKQLGLPQVQNWVARHANGMD